MLKVSLLPESYRKKVSGSKKKETLKRLFLDILIVLLAFLAVVLGTRIAVQKRLDEMMKQNAAVEAQFPQLQSYQSLYNELFQQKQLIETVSAKAPYAHDFVVSLGNVECPGLWLTVINAEDWFYTKNCTLEGKCFSNTVLKDYIKQLQKLEGVTAVTRTAYTDSGETSVTGEKIFSFTLTVTVSGTGEKLAEPTVVATTGEGASETTTGG